MGVFSPGLFSHSPFSRSPVETRRTGFTRVDSLPRGPDTPWGPWYPGPSTPAPPDCPACSYREDDLADAMCKAKGCDKAECEYIWDPNAERCVGPYMWCRACAPPREPEGA